MSAGSAFIRWRKPVFMAAAVGGAFAVAPLAMAQEGVLHGLGWVTARPGTEVSGQSVVRINGNRSMAAVESSGGKVSAGFGIAGSVDLIATTQINTVGLDALTVRGTELYVQRNQTFGSIRAIGGAASANSVLISGGAGRRPLEGSRFSIGDNRAGNIDALGAEATVLLGLGSLQLPGRASANSVLMDDSNVRAIEVNTTGNRADGIASVGGAALGNAMTVARSDLRDLRVTQHGNTARGITAGGGSAGIGWGVLASVDLTGVAAGNALTVAGSGIDGATVVQQGNLVEGMWALGGSALANSVNLADYQGASLGQWRALLSNNEARDVNATGGSGSVLKGALADVRMDASALANSISVQGGDLRGANRHVLSGNIAQGVQAIGGAAAANSVWLSESTTSASDLTLTTNTAQRIDTAGGSATLGGGLVGEFERNGRALANSVALDGRSELANSPITINRNQAADVRGSGGFAAANSVMLSHGQIKSGSIHIDGNTTAGVRANGFAGSLGAGLLFSTEQSASVLANSLGVFGSEIEPAKVLISRNDARELAAEGGKVNANSVSVEAGDGIGSRLAASVVIYGNRVAQMQSGASSMAGPAHAFSSESIARAAANSLVLLDDVRLDASSPVRITDNQASNVGAIGGTALVNTLGAYRGARIEGSPVNLSDNRAEDIATGGGYGQVAGAGKAKNGVLVANGVYLEGNGDVRLIDSPVTVSTNTARGLNADGGRINVNALSINGEGTVNGSRFLFSENQAEVIASEGSEGTLAGHAVLGRGVGHTGANSVQVMGTLQSSPMQLQGNFASNVRTSKGIALANSVAVDAGASSRDMPASLIDNRANDVSADERKTALANSVLNEGNIEASRVSIERNHQASAKASSGDAMANSVRNRAGGSIASSSITVYGNEGSADREGVVNSVDSSRVIASSQISITSNRGSASGGGLVNSVGNGGRIEGSRIQILGNQGSAEQGGLANSISNEGRIEGARITISGNRGTASRGGTVNSVKNSSSATIIGARISILGNQGTASGGGMVNSVDNQGRLTGTIDIVGNRGSTNGGGTVNSVVNRGLISGQVVISGNSGTATGGGTANSVINRGVITGKVAIIGNHSSVGPIMTTGSVRVSTGGVVSGGAGVTGNVPWATGPALTLPPTGIINNSVTVGPVLTRLNM
ncbi:MAG: hypothetical protein ABI589_01450 [Burkholderiales bacterium]